MILTLPGSTDTPPVTLSDVLPARLKELFALNDVDEPSAENTAVREPSVRLNPAERRQLDVVRRFGTVGSLLIACGGLGAGASPVMNPLPGLPVLGLFARIPTVALASAFTGMLMVVFAWVWLGRLVWPGRPRLLSRAQLDRTLVMWLLPLILLPPVFSQDVYSYLAQSAAAAHGLDPYSVGAASALGPDDPFARGVPTIWRDTPSPYGPLFLTIGRGILWLAGNSVPIGALLERALMLIGLGLLVWALPRLARRFGVQPVTALWFGAVNPLVLFHLVAGIHNEALTYGLMMAGFAIGISRLPRRSKGQPAPALAKGEIVSIFAGAIVITLGAGVKLPAIAALGFLSVLIARRWGGRIRHLAWSSAALGAVGIGAMLLITAISGLGFGWLTTLNGGNVVLSWLSPVTVIGLLSTSLGIALQLGNHTNMIVDTVRSLGWLAIVGVAITLLWKSFQGRISAMSGLGLTLTAVVIFAPVVQAWYLVWATIPLAAAIAVPRFRRPATMVCAIVSLLVPSTGSSFDGHIFMIPVAAVAALILTGLLLFMVRDKLPEPEPVQVHVLPAEKSQTTAA